MGQLYNILIERDDNNIVRQSSKLTENIWEENSSDFGFAMQNIYKNPAKVAFVGEYAGSNDVVGEKKAENNERNVELYNKAWSEQALESSEKEEYIPSGIDMTDKYIVDHTTKQYVDVSDYLRRSYDRYHGALDPLAMLTAVGNQFSGAGGDYYSPVNQDKIGVWAGHVLSVEDEPPASYNKFYVCFSEYLLSIALWRFGETISRHDGVPMADHIYDDISHIFEDSLVDIVMQGHESSFSLTERESTALKQAGKEMIDNFCCYDIETDTFTLLESELVENFEFNDKDSNPLAQGAFDSVTAAFALAVVRYSTNEQYEVADIIKSSNMVTYGSPFQFTLCESNGNPVNEELKNFLAERRPDLAYALTFADSKTNIDVRIVDGKCESATLELFDIEAIKEDAKSHSHCTQNGFYSRVKSGYTIPMYESEFAAVEEAYEKYVQKQALQDMESPEPC